MPYYEYECKECGAKLEIFQHMADPDLDRNVHRHKEREGFPLCDGLLEKKISAPMLRFIGKGFYVNDYKKK